ncbi:helix-turn-helix domain-containing protein [Chloroflexota bacterium]
MAEKFGPLLRKWRKISDLTQEQLTKELRIAIEQESYSKSDVSKWERGNKIPTEELVEELEKILSIPKGLLLRAAGYTNAAEYRRFVAGEETEGKVDTEKEPLPKRQQKEHIEMLRQMAISAIDHLPDLPDLKNEPEAFDSFNDAVVKVYRRLTGDVDDWKCMAEHLGDQGNKLEMMSSVLDDVLPGGSLVRPKLDKYKSDLEKAWFLIKIGGLKTISESSNTKRWEWEGLNQRCKMCPDKEYEPVDITPER